MPAEWAFFVVLYRNSSDRDRVEVKWNEGCTRQPTDQVDHGIGRIFSCCKLHNQLACEHSLQQKFDMCQDVVATLSRAADGAESTGAGLGTVVSQLAEYFIELASQSWKFLKRADRYAQPRIGASQGGQPLELFRCASSACDHMS